MEKLFIGRNQVTGEIVETVSFKGFVSRDVAQRAGACAGRRRS